MSLEQRTASGTSPTTVPGRVEPLNPWVYACALLAFALLMAVSATGYHRDELYFLEASHHMAWGYVDQPPFSVAIVWVSRELFGTSLVGLRLFPALADAAIVVLTGLLARELGGSRFAQALSALAVAVSPFLVAGHLAGPTIYDLLAWPVVCLLVLRILHGGDRRLWLAVGVAVGVALLDKETILLLVGGVVLGFLLTERWDVFRTPWLWFGGVIALAIWSPVLVWEGQHAWPTIEMSRSLQQEHSGLGFVPSFVLFQLLLPGWWMTPVWIAGLVSLWRDPIRRPFGIAYVAGFVFLLLLIPDRPYYVAGLYPLLLAAGVIVAEEVIAGARRFLRRGVPRQRLVWRSRRRAIGFVLAMGLVSLPLALPVLPTSALATVPLQNVNYNLGEVVGWPQFARTIAGVVQSLPSSEQQSVVLFTGNYGEAGAIDRFGPALGLPQAYSGHNNYWWWGPPRQTGGVTVAVGFDRGYLSRFFSHVTQAATIDNGLGVENDEQGEVVWVCSGRRASWSALWPRLRHYD
jgi:hypothetical protein